MVLVSMFLMNMLCAVVPCDYKNPHPEIASSPSNQYAEMGSGGYREKRLILDNSHPIVFTQQGQVQGYSMKVMSGRTIIAFEGIRYGNVTRRFEVAHPVAPWKGIRTAFGPGPHCLQIHPAKMFRVFGVENCLYLNIYTPKLPGQGIDGQNYPVMFHIHGGSYIFSSGAEYGPSYLLEKDVVLVTINYRLGVLGFMSTGDEASPGNYGMKDQALALKWVHDNIASFGGDPNRVTISGQSAGGAAAHLHLMSEMTRPYFHQAIIMSGTAHSHWGHHNASQGRQWTSKLARIVNCPDHNNTQLVECLRRMDGNWLVAAQMNLFEWMPFPPIFFAPVIEPISSNAFLTESPEETCKKGNEAKVPAIFTMTSQEGYFSNYALNGMMKTISFLNNVPKYLPYYLDYKYLAGNTNRITQRVLDYYLGSSSLRDVRIQIYAEMGTDRMFGTSVNKAIKYHSRQAPTFASLFSFLGKYNVGSGVGLRKSEWGVAHSEDLYYIFNASTYIEGFKQHDKEAELSKILINLVTNFVTKGEPFYTDKNGTDLRVWDQVLQSDEEVHLLQLNRDVRMIPDPFVKRRKFWESLGLSDTTPVVPVLSESENELFSSR